MAAQIVSITVADPPAGSCIDPSLQDWLQHAIFLQQSGLNNSQRIIQSTTAPGPDDRDALWNKISGTGAPLGLFVFYNGLWRRFPTTPIGTRAFYTGQITGVFDPITLIGIPGTEWDGWKIDLTFANLFPVIASDFNALAPGWQSTVLGPDLQQGGGASVTLDPTNVPLPSTQGLSTTLWKADGNSPIGGAGLWGVPEASFPANTVLIPPTVGNPNPVPFNVVPPFVAMAQVLFIGLQA